MTLSSRVSFRVLLEAPVNGFYRSTAQKMRFSIRDFFSKCDQIKVTFTEEILNGKPHFLCSEESYLSFFMEHFHYADTVLFNKNLLYKNHKAQKTLKIKNFRRIMLRLVFRQSEFPYCRHIISSIIFEIFLSIFLEIILIIIDYLKDA